MRPPLPQIADAYAPGVGLPFTQNELEDAIANLKRHKAPGPANLLAELYTILDNLNHSTLLEHQGAYTRYRNPPIMPTVALGPYLYIMATSLLFRDLLLQRRATLPSGLCSPALLYADDTFLLTNTAPDMTRLLDLVIAHSEHYNLRLNHDKRKLLVTGDQGVTSDSRMAEK